MFRNLSGYAGNRLVQENLDLIWAFAILVVPIFPSLGSFNGDSARAIAVFEIVAVDVFFVALNSFLIDGVSDFLTTFVFRQVGELVAPVSSCHFLFRNLSGHAVNRLVQEDLDLIWAFAVLVIAIIPCLRSFNGDSIWAIAVFEIVAVDVFFVALNSFFIDGVSDFLTAFVFRQVFELISPVILGYFLFRNLSGYAGNRLVQENLDLIWAFAILVVPIFPSLRSFNGDSS